MSERTRPCKLQYPWYSFKKLCQNFLNMTSQLPRNVY